MTLVKIRIVDNERKIIIDDYFHIGGAVIGLVSLYRKQYKRVCTILKRYKKISGHGSQSEIIHQLAEQYNKQPAFLDELAKI
jgi:hypothetical protein